MPIRLDAIRGFSLIEVMIVLALTGLLMGVVATNLTEGPVLRESAREVLASLRHARSSAIMSQKQTRWIMDTSNKSFQVEGLKQERKLSTAIELKLHTAASEVLANNRGAIRFFPDGSSTGGSVDVTYKGQTYKVNVEWVTGRVSIE
ncbi:MAG: GspH/FimT family pseudopilin [Thiofilum sp.]|uniref:GspH/FimT family pseudopilin n=1 Tax=Thiofilum sp. TaxID=2212733 RepID=UPI0025D7F93E|nr:GspH/FimT family pseudopilin [Thiofilum sp.]MBK8453184.1 GspH/FimT family pseudopilin [Thiofilum sp.]